MQKITMKKDKKSKEKLEKDAAFKEFKVPKRKQPIFNFFSKILFKPIFGVKVESMIKDLPDKAIIASIHAAKHGPMAIAVSYPKFSAMWGHHAMLGSYRDRFSYLRNVLYIQKMHKNKFIATLKASYEAIFSIYIYKGMKIIGTYTDMRLLTTVRNSMDVLDSGASVIIFPEDSSEGYFDEVRGAFSGFIMLSMLYYKRTGEDLPVIPAYVSNKAKRLIIGKPRYVREMELSGMSKDDISEVLKGDINSLFREYIATGAPVPCDVVENAPIRGKNYYSDEKNQNISEKQPNATEN